MDKNPTNVTGSPKRGRGRGRQITCYECHNIGHIKSNCPTLKGNISLIPIRDIIPLAGKNHIIDIINKNYFCILFYCEILKGGGEENSNLIGPFFSLTTTKPITTLRIFKKV